MASTVSAPRTDLGPDRVLFKKTGDTKGAFHGKMGTTKDRNSKNITEADEEEVAKIHRTI